MEPKETHIPDTQETPPVGEFIPFGVPRYAAGAAILSAMFFLFAAIYTCLYRSIVMGAGGLFLAAAATGAAGWLFYRVERRVHSFQSESERRIQALMQAQAARPEPPLPAAAPPPLPAPPLELPAQAQVAAPEAIAQVSAEISQVIAEIQKEITLQANALQQEFDAAGRASVLSNRVWEIVEQFSINAEEASTSSQKTVQVSQVGQHAVQNIMAGMAQIKSLVITITDNLQMLSSSSEEIRQITDFVRGVAAQSRILSLNASIEAAHAGEQGKGFAVVANEVRSLANQSQEATVQVKAIVEGIQAEINQTVRAAREGAQGVETGVRLAEQAGTAIEQLVQVIGQVSSLAENIEQASQQQISGIEQVVLMIQNIHQEVVESQESLSRIEQLVQQMGIQAQRLEKAAAVM